MNDAPSIVARLRAGLAGLLARLAAGAHWLEDRTAHGLRPWVLGVVALAVASIVVIGVIHERHEAAHWFGGRGATYHVGRPAPPPAPKPAGKPEGRHEDGPAGKPEGRREGGPFARPGAPVPPPPPPPAPPAPPAAGIFQP